MEYTLDQALQKGVEAHKAGKVQEADRYYTAILKANPNHPDANHNMGVLAVGIGKVETALPFFKTALDTNPNIDQFWISYIDALIKLDRLDEASEVFKTAKTKGVKGNGFEQLKKRLAELEQDTEVNDTPRGTEEPPDAKLQNLINLYTQSQYKEALHKSSKLVEQFPNSIHLYNIIGAANQNLGQLDEAIEAYNKALIIKPDFAEVYNNLSELLKTYSYKPKKSHILFEIDIKIKKISPRLIKAKSNKAIIDNLLEGLSYISENDYGYKTPLSQIYKRNNLDLNCKRHKKIFDTKEIIPEFCFGCFKVQVEVATFIDLIKVTSLFYKFNFEHDLLRKTSIELRPYISGDYKGLIYCRGLDQAKRVKKMLDIDLKEVFDGKITSNIKRGCSEYPLKFPDYGKIPQKSKDIISFPKEWKPIEKQFDQNELIMPNSIMQASLPKFCISDFFIIQKWIDYAKGIGDQSVEIFNDTPIIFNDVYNLAKIRTVSS